jgi:hypothetical protein
VPGLGAAELDLVYPPSAGVAAPAVLGRRTYSAFWPRYAERRRIANSPRSSTMKMTAMIAQNISSSFRVVAARPFSWCKATRARA